jgi:hypothetical protein
MKYEIENQKVKDFFEKYDQLESLLTERISDLHEIKGMIQARHAYIFYRELLWGIKKTLVDGLKEVKEKKK